MNPTLNSGDIVFINQYAYGIPTPKIPRFNIKILPDSDGDGYIMQGERPKRGDIVTFFYPLDEQTIFIKRVFAVGGDEVIFDSKNLYLRTHEGDEYIDKTYDKADIIVLNGSKFIKNLIK